MQKSYLVDPALYDLDKPIADLEGIRRFNQQRFEMEMLTAIVHDDWDSKSCVGYHDLTEQDFWVRGHMPNFALMPGILMCEVAAQLASYYVGKHELMTDCIMGFAGLENVRFRGIVTPNNRFVIQAKLLHCRKKLISALFQGILGEKIVCEGVIKGVPLGVSDLHAVSRE